MIVEYKSKEQKFNESMEGLREFFSDNDFKRLERIFRGRAEGNDRIVISNNFIKIKNRIRKAYKNIEKYSCMKKSSDELLDFEYIEAIDEGIKGLKDYLLDLGDLLINFYMPLIDKYFNKQEIAQLIGGSCEQIKRIDEWYEKKETGTKSIMQSYILHHGEYRWRRGRSKDFIDCPRWEMPLFWCMTDYMWIAINNSPRLKQDMNDKFEELFADSMLDVTFDNQGNVISVEKITQELTARELIRNFRGKFINELKKGNVFGNEKKYKVKRLQGNIYSINNDAERIYKKN